ncbi:MAG: hypothetical protein NTZ05_10895 [Chloroflexi bacterium]|nr:hypothetical protein [Chloroflexota bacterium]
MAQQASDAVPVFLYHGDAVVLRLWLAAQPIVGGPAAVRERLNAALANNTNPIRLWLTPVEAAATVAILHATLSPYEHETKTAQRVLGILDDVISPDGGRPWRHKPPPTHW